MNMTDYKLNTMVRACYKLSRIKEVYMLKLRLREMTQEITPLLFFYFTKHRSVKNTNIAHRRVSDHLNTASWDFIHRIATF